MTDERDKQENPAGPMSEQEALIASLPQSMRDQLRNGIVDVNNLTPEQLRGLTISAAADGGIADLAFATRGSTGSTPNDWKGVVDEGADQGLHHPEHMAVLPGPNLPDAKGRNKTRDLPD